MTAPYTNGGEAHMFKKILAFALVLTMALFMVPAQAD